MAHSLSSIHLTSKGCSVIIDVSKRTPSLIYFGNKLTDLSSSEMIRQLETRQEGKCSPVEEPLISLTPTYGAGFIGSVGLSLANASSGWSTQGQISDVEYKSENSVVVTTVDVERQLAIVHQLTLEHETDVLAISTKVINQGSESVTIDWCAASTVPVPERMEKIKAFEGRWAKEFQEQTIDRHLGSYVRENRRGKTSHDSFPGFIVHEQHTTQHQGRCYGFHLGWSGNHKLICETLADGRGFVQMGELLLPGEVVLKAGQSYESPTLYSCYSSNGFNQMSASFHDYVRQQLLSQQVTTSPRQVHYNTWEGIYFDHDTDTLAELAKQAAEIGAERFVLDDGWFKGRRGDYAGLGDWTVDKTIYPEGLQPLISQVLATGMSFGLWFEPEMVNPDSDLYRAHPDWVLSSEGNEQLTYRNQLLLDLTRQEVTDYLYHAINDILTEYPDISYIKWDMNRDINHAGNGLQKPAIRQQTLALYALINRLKKSHPEVEIESCSSGGGRVDYGVLAHTDRVWTSDSNDALDRLAIQRGCSYFFPAEVMGAHVGPRDCHITGRRVSVEMRAAVAMFGHMGLEMDPRELTDHERKQLKQAITIHKAHRSLIHGGTLVRLNNGESSIDFGLVNREKTEALFAYNQISESLRYLPGIYRFEGLRPDVKYRLSLVWPTELSKVKEYSPSVLSKIHEQIYSGELLMELGMQLPILDPQSSLVFKLIQVD